MALEAYLIALNDTNNPKTKSLICLNLALTYLAFGSFESCLKFSLKVLDTDPVNVKGLYRAGRAFYELRRFQDAKEYFQKVIEVEKGHPDATREFERCKKRLQEGEGHVCIYDLFKNANANPKTCLDCGDYIGPVEIALVHGKGRGVVAKCDIAPGTLLVVSKALEVAFHQPLDPENEDVKTCKLLQQATQMVLKNLNTLGKIISDMTSGSSYLDKQRIDFCDESSIEEPIIDTRRLREILSSNCFEICSCISTNTHEGKGIFEFPSYFNHSCVPNAIWRTYNDIFVVHAVQSINRGEEVNLSYHNMNKDCFTRDIQFSVRNFKCKCELCILDDDLSLSNKFKVKSLINKNMELTKNGEKVVRDIQTLEKIIQELEDLYKCEGRERLKVPLLYLYLRLGSAFFEVGNNSETLVLIDKTFATIGLNSHDLLKKARKGDPDIFPVGSGTFVFDYAPEICSMAIGALGSLKPLGGNSSKIKNWMKLLALFESVCFGGNMDMVKARHPLIDFMSTFSSCKAM